MIRMAVFAVLALACLAAFFVVVVTNLIGVTEPNSGLEAVMLVACAFFAIMAKLATKKLHREVSAVPCRDE